MLRIFIANLSGRLILVAISIISIPIYIRYIGVANYGILGIYNSIAGLLTIFDIAFSNTISLELAKTKPADLESHEIGAVFRTLEIFAWAVAITLAALLIIGAKAFVIYWIGISKYPDQDTVGTVRLMGTLLLLQAPTSFYSGCLYGMHKHTLINGLNVFGSALSAVLSITAVIFISATVNSIFLSQFLGRLVLLASMAFASYSLLSRNEGKIIFRASAAAWRRLWRFAAGMNGIGILSLVINQADLIILTRFLSATSFGSYTIARTVSQSLIALAMPAYQSAFPQLTKLAWISDPSEFAAVFHRFCQFLSFVIIPPAIVIIVFAHEVLQLWTHNASLADNAWPTLSLLTAGSLIYGLSSMISAVQMAKGALPSMLFTGLLFVIFLIPSLIVLGRLLNESGAALAWLLVNVLVLTVSANITLRRYVPGSFRTWITRDILLNLMAASTPVVILKAFVSGPSGSVSAAASLVASAVLALGVSAIVIPEVRGIASQSLRFIFRMSSK